MVQLLGEGRGGKEKRFLEGRDVLEQLCESAQLLVFIASHACDCTRVRRVSLRGQTLRERERDGVDVHRSTVHFDSYFRENGLHSTINSAGHV